MTVVFCFLMIPHECERHVEVAVIGKMNNELAFASADLGEIGRAPAGASMTIVNEGLGGGYGCIQDVLAGWE